MCVQLYEILSVSPKGCTNLDFGQQCMSTLLPYILSILIYLAFPVLFTLAMLLGLHCCDVGILS